jgi:hypothetical protein
MPPPLAAVTEPAISPVELAGESESFVLDESVLR